MEPFRNPTSLENVRVMLQMRGKHYCPEEEKGRKKITSSNSTRRCTTPNRTEQKRHCQCTSQHQIFNTPALAAFLVAIHGVAASACGSTQVLRLDEALAFSPISVLENQEQ